MALLPIFCVDRGAGLRGFRIPRRRACAYCETSIHRSGDRERFRRPNIAPNQVGIKAAAIAPVGFAKLGPVNSETKLSLAFGFFTFGLFVFGFSAFSFSRGSDWVTLNRSIRRLARPLFSPRQF